MLQKIYHLQEKAIRLKTQLAMMKSERDKLKKELEKLRLEHTELKAYARRNQRDLQDFVNVKILDQPQRCYKCGHIMSQTGFDDNSTVFICGKCGTAYSI